MPDFFSSIKNDFGRNKEEAKKRGEKTELDELDDMEVKERKKLNQIYGDISSSAHHYYFGNVFLQTNLFVPPSNWAASDFNIRHGRELASTWCTIGLLFPDKVAVVCVFNVRFVKTSRLRKSI